MNDEGDAMMVRVFKISLAILLAPVASCGQPSSDDEVIEFSRRWCEQGIPTGCLQLGTMHRHGRGVPQDYNRAAMLYGQACDGGVVEGCVWLGDLYVRGQGVTQSRVHAHALYNVAAARGHNSAPSKRNRLARNMAPLQIAEAEALAHGCSQTRVASCIRHGAF